jgi:ABC-type amino acid transport substrate-binding protein
MDSINALGRILVFMLIFTVAVSCGKSDGSGNAGSEGPQPIGGDSLGNNFDAPLAGSSWSEVIRDGRGVLTAIYVPAAGFAYINDAGQLTGVVIDILYDFVEFAREQHGVEITLDFVEDTNWRRFYRRVVDAGDGVIGMGNVTITEPRRSELHFSPPYMTNIAALITHSDVPELAELPQLGHAFAHLEALAFEGTLHQTRLRELIERYHPDAGIAFATTNDEIIDRVSAGSGYFAYIDIYNYHRATEEGRAVRRHPAGDESAEEFGYIMPLQTTWGEVLGEFFAAEGGLLTRERYREIMSRHLGESLASILIDG